MSDLHKDPWVMQRVSIALDAIREGMTTAINTVRRSKA